MKKYLFFILLLQMACGRQSSLTDEQKTNIDTYLAQYAPYEMHYDASHFTGNDKLILQKLVEAAGYIDKIYWLQTSKYGLGLRDSLAKIKDDPYAAKLLTLVKRNAGPFEALNGNVPFLGNQDFYSGGEIYPRGMTAETFDAYTAKLSDAEKAEFMYPYTVIREDGSGGYSARRYYQEYKDLLDPVIGFLQECAGLSDNKSFSKFLRLKAEALKTDNYFDADVAWLDTKNNKFDIVFGPFETYSDGIKGVKAKYEAYIEIVDQEESEKLKVYTAYLQELEENLPVTQNYKSVVKGLTANFVVVRDIIRAGEGGVGYQAVATNLPNDPAVHKQKGTKKTFWKNMFVARFNAIIKPVSLRLIDESQLQHLSDQGFFQFVLMHEICHAVGPRTVKMGPNKGMAANASIGPNYNALEECKADVTGLYSLAYLMDNGVVDKSREHEFYVSYLGSLFRSVRFGLNQAHGKAAAIELNYLLENGGILFDEQTKRWAVDFSNFRQGIRKLATDLVVLLGDGDNGSVATFFDKWAKMTPRLQQSLDSVSDLPTDVLPRYSIKWE